MSNINLHSDKPNGEHTVCERVVHARASCGHAVGKCGICKRVACRNTASKRARAIVRTNDNPNLFDDAREIAYNNLCPTLDSFDIFEAELRATELAMEAQILRFKEGNFSSNLNI